ncbi:MAG: HAMP domain-containing sensor histidine kinase [Planctomycetia bacterium]|nr:HAMP domain-containing sensor histidine kinase [Planctomycetia bacterium]
MSISPRSSFSLPITIGIIMIILVILLGTGWIISTMIAAKELSTMSSLYWWLLVTGSFFLCLILAGTITYLVFSIKVIHLNRQQSNFIDSVTHELKSPLASLKLYTQTLTKYEVSPKEKQKFYLSMMEDIERLDLLINQVLRAGQLETEKNIVIFEETFHLEPLVENAIRSACLCHNVHESHVLRNFPDDRVTFPRIPLEMILRNLIDNAVKYAGIPPKICIDIRWGYRNACIIRISDNGPGIHISLRKKVFRRFFRAGNELERKKTGTGLGLYLVHLYVKLLRGKIRIRTNKLGGTTFHLILPLNVTSKHSLFLKNKQKSVFME